MKGALQRPQLLDRLCIKEKEWLILESKYLGRAKLGADHLETEFGNKHIKYFFRIQARIAQLVASYMKLI